MTNYFSNVLIKFTLVLSVLISAQFSTAEEHNYFDNARAIYKNGELRIVFPNININLEEDDTYEELIETVQSFKRKKTDGN